MADQDNPSSNIDPSAAAQRPAYVTSRLRYFNGEFLGTQDFIDEQNYHTDRQVRHEQSLHAPGILYGLDVLWTAGGGALTVTAGSALDEDGNQILIASDQTLSPSSDGFSAQGIYCVDVKFQETADEPDAMTKGNTRWSQEAKGSQTPILAIGASQRAASVLLAKVTVGVSGSITAVDTGCQIAGGTRVYAGLRLPGPIVGPTTGDRFTATLRVTDINRDTTSSPDYWATFDKNLQVTGCTRARSGSNEGTLGSDALYFLNSPASIWAHNYSMRILFASSGVEIQAGQKIVLSTNNVEDPAAPDPANAPYLTIHTLVAHETGDVGIGIDQDDPKARLEVKAASGETGLQVTSAAGNALLTVNDSAATATGAAPGLTRVTGAFRTTNGATSESYFHYDGRDVRLVLGGNGSGGRALVHDTGNTLTLNWGGDFSGGTKIASTLGVTGLVTAQAGLTVSSGALSVASGSLTAPSSGLTIDGGSVSLASGRALTVGGALTAQSGLSITGGNLAGPSGGLTISGGPVTVSPALTASAGITISAGGLAGPSGGLTISGGPVTVSAVLTASTGLTVQSGDLGVVAGNLSLADGAMVSFGSGQNPGAGVIQACDANHQIVFGGRGNLLEVREYGSIYLTAGYQAPAAGAAQPPPSLTVQDVTLGNVHNACVGVGVGTATPLARLEVKSRSDGAGLQVTSSTGHALLTVADSVLTVHGPTSLLGPMTSNVSSSTNVGVITASNFTVATTWQTTVAMSTDGFLVFCLVINDMTVSNGTTYGDLQVWTGTTSSPTTSVGRISVEKSYYDKVDSTNKDTTYSVTDFMLYNTVTIPVRKGEYWKATATPTSSKLTVTANWIPFGN